MKRHTTRMLLGCLLAMGLFLHGHAQAVNIDGDYSLGAEANYGKTCLYNGRVYTVGRTSTGNPSNPWSYSWNTGTTPIDQVNIGVGGVARGNLNPGLPLDTQNLVVGPGSVGAGVNVSLTGGGSVTINTGGVINGTTSVDNGDFNLVDGHQYGAVNVDDGDFSITGGQLHSTATVTDGAIKINTGGSAITTKITSDGTGSWDIDKGLITTATGILESTVTGDTWDINGTNGVSFTNDARINLNSKENNMTITNGVVFNDASINVLLGGADATDGNDIDITAGKFSNGAAINIVADADYNSVKTDGATTFDSSAINITSADHNSVTLEGSTALTQSTVNVTNADENTITVGGSATLANSSINITGAEKNEVNLSGTAKLTNSKIVISGTAATQNTITATGATVYDGTTEINITDGANHTTVDKTGATFTDTASINITPGTATDSDHNAVNLTDTAFNSGANIKINDATYNTVTLDGSDFSANAYIDVRNGADNTGVDVTNGSSFAGNASITVNGSATAAVGVDASTFSDAAKINVQNGSANATVSVTNGSTFDGATSGISVADSNSATVTVDASDFESSAQITLANTTGSTVNIRNDATFSDTANTELRAGTHNTTVNVGGSGSGATFTDNSYISVASMAYGNTVNVVESDFDTSARIDVATTAPTGQRGTFVHITGSDFQDDTAINITGSGSDPAATVTVYTNHMITPTKSYEKPEARMWVTGIQSNWNHITADGASTFGTGTDTPGINIAGNHNYVEVLDGTVFAAGSFINGTGGTNHVYVTGTADFKTGSSIDLRNGNNLAEISLGSLTQEQAAKTAFNGDLGFAGDNNWLVIGGNTHVTSATQIDMGTGIENVSHYTNWSHVSSDKQVTNNLATLIIDKKSEFDGYERYTGYGNTLIVNQDMRDNANPADPMSGQVVFDALTADTRNNTVFINQGLLTNLQGSVMGSDFIATDFFISGISEQFDEVRTNAKLLISGAAKSTYLVYEGGQVDNIRAKDNDGAALDRASVPGDYLASVIRKDDIATEHEITYLGDDTGDKDYVYKTYSLLNMNLVTLADNAVLHIGSIGDLSTRYAAENDVPHYTQHQVAANSDGLAVLGNQISANKVIVDTGTKLYVHEDERMWGVANTLGWGTGNENRNVVNTLEVYGAANIDRTTIHGANPGEAVINVYGGGTILGFGEFKNATTDHDPLRAQLVGTLNLFTGATFKPYDTSLFTIVDESLRGTVFEVAAAGNKGGVSNVHQASIWDGRLFNWGDNRTVTMFDGVTYDTHYSDSLKTVDADFRDVWNNGVELAQDRKVQYKPTIGFQFDLKSKLEFKPYISTEGQVENYFAVVNANKVIDEIVNYDNANHLFNRDILISDMLANYHFGKKQNNEGIYLRYRQIARHPYEGGIAIDQSRPNNANVGHLLDEIRYPFQTDYTDLSFPSADPSATDPLTYDIAGYDGDMIKYYKENSSFFANYQDYYVEDLAALLLGIQREIESLDTMDRAMRQLHAEPYATLTNVGFSTMDGFIANRERNSVSALYEVEAKLKASVAARTEGQGYASIAQDCEPDDLYVANPVRFWASAFGQDLKQRNRGHEYGYDSETYGGAVGVIKEWRNLYAGLTIGYADVDTDWHSISASAKTKSYLAEAHLGYRFGFAFLEAHANYAYNDNDLERRIRLGTYNRTAKSDYHDTIYGGGLRLGYQYVLWDSWLVVPTIGVTWMRSETHDLDQEQGAWNQATLLRFRDSKMQRDLVKVPVTVRINRPFNYCSWIVTPELRAGVTPIFGDRNASIGYELMGNPNPNRFTNATGLDIGRYVANIGATVELSRRGRFYAAANYDFFVNNKGHAHNYSLQTGINF